jgi:hypothetical protein
MRPALAACVSTVSWSASLIAPSSMLTRCARKDLRRARHETAFGRIEYAAQDHLHRLIDEQRRHRNIALEKPGIKRFERRRRKQLIAKANQPACSRFD